MINDSKKDRIRSVSNSLFDVSKKECINFFNRISRILYYESSGEQKYTIRSIIANVLESDIIESIISFDKNILIDENFISKYCFYDKDECDIAFREYRVYILKDIPNDKKIDIRYRKRIMVDDVDIFYIYIHHDICTDKTTVKDKFDLISSLFNDYMLNLSSINYDESLKSKIIYYSKFISLVFSSLLIDYSIKEKPEIEFVVNELLCVENSYIINGVPEVRLSVNKSDEIFGVIKSTINNSIIYKEQG